MIIAEFLSDPLPYDFPCPQIASPAVAMARDNTGVAIAWSMPNGEGALRIYVARLNATGHVAGTVHELPVPYSGLVNATSPSIAAGPTASRFPGRSSDRPTQRALTGLSGIRLLLRYVHPARPLI